MEHALRTFVDVSRRQGLTDEEIRQGLLKQSWKEEEISAALASSTVPPVAMSTPQTAPAPQPTSQSAPQRAFAPASGQNHAPQEPIFHEPMAIPAIPPTFVPIAHPPAEQPVPTQPFYKKKSFYWIVGVGLLLVILMFAASVAVQNNFYGWSFLNKDAVEKEQANGTADTSTSSEQITDTSTSTPVQTNQTQAAGTLYTGYGLSFKYPSEWKFEYDQGGVLKFSPKISGKESLAIWIFTDDEIDPDDGSYPAGVQVTESKVTVGGKTVEKMITVENRPGESIRNVFLLIPYTNKPGMQVMVMASCSVSVGQCSTDIDNVVNSTIGPSFKFE